MFGNSKTQRYKGSAVYRSNQEGTLYRWYHGATGTDTGTDTE
jgi:hypothetical protein